MNIYSVAIVGVTGYSGREADRILKYHPSIKVTGRFASKSDGSGIEAYSLDAVKRAAPDVVITATEHDVSMRIVPELLAAGFRVIDMSGAFRMKDAALYPKWYGFEHTSPALLQEAVYGLTGAVCGQGSQRETGRQSGMLCHFCHCAAGAAFCGRRDRQERAGCCRWQVRGFWRRTSSKTGNAFLRSE